MDEARVVELSGGRRLGLAEYGDPEGVPVFYFHGLLSSRLEARPHDAILRELGVRLISLDRPGVGASSPQPERTLAGFAVDVRAVADRLGVDELRVVGASAGGACALSVAAELPERTARAVVLPRRRAPADARVPARARLLERPS